MKKKKVVYIISKIRKAGLEFEWVAKKIDREKIDIVFINLNPSGSIFNERVRDNIPFFHINYHNKTNLFSAFFRLIKLLRQLKPDIIHTHMLDASLIGLFVGWILRIDKRIYTRHHSSFNHVYHPKKKIYDYWCNFFATDIISISPCVTTILTDWEGVDKNKITYIPHGIDHEYFRALNSKEFNEYKKALDLDGKWPIVGVLSRFIEWKGVEYTIEAFKMLLNDYPNAVLLAAGAKGPKDFERINGLFETIPKESRMLIDFQNDARMLFGIFDVFVHVPVDEYAEAFGQIYIESLSLGVPSVFTKSGIANEIAHHKKNSYVVPYRNSKSIYNGIVFLLKDDSKASLIARGKSDSLEYNVEKKLSQLEKMYLE